MKNHRMCRDYRCIFAEFVYNLLAEVLIIRGRSRVFVRF